MKLSKKWKKNIYILGGILVFLAVIVLSINLIIGHIISNKVRQALDKMPEKNYHIDVRTVRANILTGNINLKDLRITPDSLYLKRLKTGKANNSTAIQLHIPTLRFAGIKILDAISKGSIRLRTILFKKADLTIILGKKPEKKVPKKASSGLDIDSIYIAGLNGVSIGSIEFRKSKLEIYDLVKEKVLLKNEDLRFELKDFSLEELEGNNDYFSLHLEDAKLEMKNEKFLIPGGNYYLEFGRVFFNLADYSLELNDMIFTPLYKDKYKLARKLTYTSEIYDVSVRKIKIGAIDFKKLFGQGAVYLDSVMVDGLNLSILMDKRLPFNTKRRPKLPNEALKNMKLPLYIGKIVISNSYLNYQEKIEGSKDLMTAILGDMNANISFATSVKDSIKTRKSMEIELRAKFMEKTPLFVYFKFPLYSSVDTFYYSGEMASARMNYFNKASLPAMGLKFKKGKLQKVTFRGTANPNFSKGTMTMLYTDLEAEIVKKNEKDKNKFVSWAANTVIYKSNPGKNNKLRTASMEFKRVPYKGFGNLMWKTLQSGIVRTVVPSTKSKKTSDDTGQKSVKTKEKRKKKKKKQK